MPKSVFIDEWDVNQDKGVVYLTAQLTPYRYGPMGLFRPFYRYHAVLMIESYVENVGVDISMFHFCPDGNVRRKHILSKVREQIMQDNHLNSEYYSAWYLDSQKVNQLYENVVAQLPSSQIPNTYRDKQREPPKFSLVGSYVSRSSDNLGPHNCTSWIQSELIKIDFDENDVIYSNPWDNVAIMPTSHIGHIGHRHSYQG